MGTITIRKIREEFSRSHLRLGERIALQLPMPLFLTFPTRMPDRFIAPSERGGWEVVSEARVKEIYGRDDDDGA